MKRHTLWADIAGLRYMRYTTLLFDLDHTLFDFDASEVEAFAAALARAGVEVGDDDHDLFVTINAALWKRVEAGELSPNDVRVVRFEQLFSEVGVEADVHRVADDYLVGLGRYGDLFPGARDLLAGLSGEASLALVSNGIGQVVRDKVERLDLARYFDAIVISGEVGVAKPHSEFFDMAFERLGHPEKATTLMIGDSLASDIQGGYAYGIDTCWYAPKTQTEPTPAPTYRVRRLSEIPALVEG
jgi:YjjG family noncanonical pyrimidine nucleotidase